MGGAKRRQSISHDALAVFGDYLAKISHGEHPDFEELCREHPQLERELRQLRSAGASAETSVSDGNGSDDRDSDYLLEILERLGGRNATFQRYRVDEEIGRGGMGSVLRVWDEDLRRTLAMKVILEAGGADDKKIVAQRSRFLDEAQVSGQLHHPGILPVHELGLDDQGRLYFTMPLVKGNDLKGVLELVHAGAENWSTTRALGILLKVCEAMAYAHSKNVIHRDLKPANIMVGRFGEVYVMDWGIARILGVADKKDIRIRPAAEAQTVIGSDRADARDSDPSSPLVTMDGDVIGTPAYMSPEQASGQLEVVSPASDVYSIGAILYHLLAGEAPYTSRDRRQNPYVLLLLIQDAPPRPLQQLAPQVPAELVAIVEKAMARRPEDRFGSMAELADDLRAFLEHRVVRAYRTGAVVEFSKWVQRNKGMAASIAAAVLLAIGGLARTNYVQARMDRKVKDAERAGNEYLTDLLPAVIQTMDIVKDRSDETRKTLTGVIRRTETALKDGRFAEAPLSEAAIRLSLGNTYRKFGDYSEAAPHLNRAEELFAAHLEPDHPQLLGSRADLEALRGELSARAARVDRVAKLLEERTRSLGPKDPHTLNAMNNLANVYAEQGRFEDARDLHRQTLELCTEVLGLDNVETLKSMSNLASVSVEMGDYAAAKPLMEEALDAQVALLGPSNPECLRTMNNLAFLLLTAEPAGLRDPERALSLAQDVNGLSPGSCWYLETLARAHYVNGDRALAIATQRRALELLPPEFALERAQFESSLTEYESSATAGE